MQCGMFADHEFYWKRPIAQMACSAVLFIMGPQPNDFDNRFIIHNLINQPMVNIYPSQIGSR
jgi:hypothetical protein